MTPVYMEIFISGKSEWMAKLIMIKKKKSKQMKLNLFAVDVFLVQSQELYT